MGNPANTSWWLAASLGGLALVATVVTAIGGCTPDPSAGTLQDNVGASFAPCQESEIKFLSSKHNFQPVFEPCGVNAFLAFAWSPDGTRVYFQLGETGYVMNAAAEDKRNLTVPTTSPIGAAAWLSASMLAIPVLPDQAGGPNRLALFDVDQQSVFTRDVPHAVVRRAWKGPAGSVLLDVADAEGGPRRVVSLDPNDGALGPALTWLEPGYDTLTVTEAAAVVTVGRGTTVTVHDLADGTVKHTFSPATRGTVHPDGLWIALEHEGEAISIFYQRAWDDMTEAQRNRERQRADKLAENLPASSPTTVRPPTLSFADLRDGARFELTSVFGSEFEWYEARPYYASFILWGYEGKEFRRNVLLGQMGARMRATELGREFLGVVPMNDIAKARTGPTDGTTPPVEVTDPGAVVPTEVPPIPTEVPPVVPVTP